MYDAMISTILMEHPEFKSIEEVQSECKRRGETVGVWPIYFAAKSSKRRLVRSPEPSQKAEVIRDIALNLLIFHESVDGAIATIEKVASLNFNGERIPWETEKLTVSKTWKESVAQELLDLCEGSTTDATKALTTC